MLIKLRILFLNWESSSFPLAIEIKVQPRECDDLTWSSRWCIWNECEETWKERRFELREGEGWSLVLITWIKEQKKMSMNEMRKGSENQVRIGFWWWEGEMPGLQPGWLCSGAFVYTRKGEWLELRFTARPHPFPPACSRAAAARDTMNSASLIPNLWRVWAPLQFPNEPSPSRILDDDDAGDDDYTWSWFVHEGTCE